MVSFGVQEIRISALRSLMPPPQLRLSEWIEANINLPASISATPGRMRLHAWQRGVADAIGDPAIERVSVIKAARVGYTSLIVATLASYLANEPCPVICLMPTDGDARDFVVTDVEQTFSASPVLAGLLSPENDETGRSTLLHRIAPGGGSLRVIASRAPRNLRRVLARVLLCDEVDAMQIIASEGSPLKLAEQRTLTYSNRKIIIGSTPILEETSAVLQAYGESDQRIFEVPCPECGAYSEIRWQAIEWEPDKPETAAWRCPHCAQLIAERHKAGMVERGVWRATRPEISGHAGFRLSALISTLPNASWKHLARDFLKAKDNPDLLQPFINTVLGEAWRGPGGELSEVTLASRAEPWDLNDIPEEVLAVTIGADVQDDRIEATVCGWTKTQECLILAHYVIWGAFTDPATWDEFDELLRSKWKHKFGGELKVDAAVVDAGDGDHYDAVLNFCAPRISRRVFAGKGMFGNRPGFALAKGKRVGGRLAIVGVDVLKSVIFDRLSRGQGIRFSASLEPSFYEQMASERRVLRYKRGIPSRRFERVSLRARAEALDATVYAFSARQSLNIVFSQREDQLRAPATPAATLPVIRSKWMTEGSRRW